MVLYVVVTCGPALLSSRRYLRWFGLGYLHYWFRRVGKHPIFVPLAEAALPLLDKHGDSRLAGRLISGKAWNASAMIDGCTAARPGTPEEAIVAQMAIDRGRVHFR